MTSDSDHVARIDAISKAVRAAGVAQYQYEEDGESVDMRITRIR